MKKRTVIAAAICLALSGPGFSEVRIDGVGSAQLVFEGLVQSDYDFFDSDNISIPDASHIRRAELVLKGKLKALEWTAGYDVEGEKWLDVNARYAVRDNFGLRVGQYKQPNSLEELGSTKHNDFVSKALITNTFGIGRRLGVQLETTGANWILNGSVFGAELTHNRAHGSGYGARFAYAPIADDDNVLHFGVSYADYDTDADTLRFRARPADLSSVRLVDSGSLVNTDRVGTMGFETAWLRGPFKLQAEYMSSQVKRYGGAPNYKVDGWYVSGLWNITGESWSYKGGVIKTPAPSASPPGMWQLALRYDTLNLNSGTVLGGTERDLTVGLNYYWRTNWKFLVDYTKVSTERRSNSDDPSVVQARIQLYW